MGTGLVMSGSKPLPEPMLTQINVASLGHNELPGKPSGAEMRIFWEKWVNTMAADALAPSVSKPSAAMLLTI